MVLVNKTMKESLSNNNLGLREVIKQLSINNERKHLTELQFTNIIYYFFDKDGKGITNIQNKINSYKKTIDKYPTIDMWENAPVNEKIFKVSERHTSNALYYQIMVVANRIRVDESLIMNSYWKFIPMVSKLQKQRIYEVILELKYSKSQIDIITLYLSKIMMVRNKEFEKINAEDIYKFREYGLKATRNLMLFNIARRLCDISEEEKYQIKACRTQIDNIINLNKELVDTYYNYVDKTRMTECTSTAAKSIGIAREFLNWMWQQYPRINKVIGLKINHINDYAHYIKNRKLIGRDGTLSYGSFNTNIQALKRFLMYMSVFYT